MTEHHDDGGVRSGRLASELIGAGRRERASESARQRATQALLTGIVAPSAAAAKAGIWTAGLKWLGMSVMLGGAGGGLWHLAVHRPDEVERRAHLSHPPAPATQREVLAGNARSTNARAAPSSAAPPASAPSPRRAAPVAVVSPPASRGAAVVRSETDRRLAQELLALNSARTAVVGGSPEQALATLDGVAGGFRVLTVEAGLVRVEALRGAGKRDAARALCEQLLRAHPDGPYTERLRSLTASLGPSPRQP
jgi:hypothetical protein